MKYLTVNYDDGSALVLEGLGRETILGAIRDVTEPNFASPRGARVTSILLSDDDNDLVAKR